MIPDAMHHLALVIELAALLTPIVGIVVEWRRDISDDGDGGRPQGTGPLLGQRALSAG